MAAKKAESNIVGYIVFANGEEMAFTDASDYLKSIREELPYHPTTGICIKTLTDDPQVRKAVDDALYNLYDMENPRVLEDYCSYVPEIKMEI